MVKRSIKQEIRNKNFGSRNGNFEKNAVVKNQGTKQRVQRILGDCWRWETNGQCVKGDNCSFRHDMNKRGKVTPSNPSREQDKISVLRGSPNMPPNWESPQNMLETLSFPQQKTVCPLVTHMEHHGNSKGTGKKKQKTPQRVETRFKTRQ